MESHNIISLLSDMGSGKYHIGNYNVIASCPLAPWRHGKGVDKRPSLSVKIAVNEVSPVCCWSASCNFKGTMWSLAREYERLAGVSGLTDKAASYDNVSWAKRFDFKSYDESRKFYYAESKKKSDIIFGDDLIKREIEKFNIHDFKKFIWHVPQFYFKRGLTKETAKAWYVGLIDPKPSEFTVVEGEKKWLGKYKNLQKGIFFPVFDHKNRFVGYTIRGLFDWQRKFLHADGMHKEWFLYGENMIQKERGALILVEGPWDTQKMWQCGFNGLGLLGGSMSEIQQEKAIDFNPADYVITMFDGDVAGRKLTLKVKEAFKGRMMVRNIELPEGKDPDDLPDFKIKDMIQKVMA